MKKKDIIIMAVVAMLVVITSCATEEEEADYIGTWAVSNAEVPGPAYVDAVVTIRDDGTYESLIYIPGSTELIEGSSRGTYACSHGIFYARATSIYDTDISDWIDSGLASAAPYSVSGNTLTIHQDFDQNGIEDAVWNLTRQ
jgi:hypothetical protein